MTSRTTHGLLVVLVVVTMGSLWHTRSVEHEKRRLAAAYEHTQQMASELERERLRLNEDLLGARQTIDGQSGDLKSLRAELADLTQRLDETKMQLASLQRDHEAMRQHETTLRSQLDAVMTEKQQLQGRLSSLRELKLAMREVKRTMRREQWAAWMARVARLKTRQASEDEHRLAMGNRGYVVRDGIPMLGSAVRLHVHVLEPESP